MSFNSLTYVAGPRLTLRGLTRSCLHSREAHEERREAEEPFVVCVQLVVACGDPAIMLEAVEEPLHSIAELVACSIVTPSPMPLP